MELVNPTVWKILFNAHHHCCSAWLNTGMPYIKPLDPPCSMQDPYPFISNLRIISNWVWVFVASKSHMRRMSAVSFLKAKRR
jgi:hypothetical protein